MISGDLAEDWKEGEGFDRLILAIWVGGFVVFPFLVWALCVARRYYTCRTGNFALY